MPYNMVRTKFFHRSAIYINFAFIIQADIIIHSTNTKFLTIQGMRVNTVQAYLSSVIFYGYKSEIKNQFLIKLLWKSEA